MASANHYCHMLLSLLVITLMNIHPCLSFDAQTEEIVQKICRQMEDFGFCYGTFQHSIKSQSADIARLTQVTLEQTSRNANNTHNIVVQLLRRVKDQPTKNALVACENAYRVVVQAFKDATGDFNRKDYDSMVTDESVAPRAQASCEITFITPPSPVDPLKDINRQMRILVAMAVVTGHVFLGYR